MAVNLSPVGGVAAQFFDNNGNPLSGGKLYTYVAGTTTPATTYTTIAGITAHTNPIILDSAGRVPGGEIWLTNSVIYKFVLKTSTDVTIATYDNISGISTLTLPLSSNNVEYDPPFAGALTSGYTVQDKLAQTVSVKDFGAVGDGTTDDSAAFVAAFAAARTVYCDGSKTYLIKNVTIGTHKTLYCNGAIFKTAPGALFGFRVTGFRPALFDGYFTDNDYEIPNDLNHGFVYVTDSRFPVVQNCQFVNHSTGLFIDGTGNEVAQGTFSVLRFSNFQARGVLVKQNVNTCTFSDIRCYSGIDIAQGRPKTGAMGFQIASTGSTLAYGGHLLNMVDCEESQYGIQLTDCNLITLQNCIGDSVSNAAFQVTGSSNYIKFVDCFAGTCLYGFEITGTATNTVIANCTSVLAGVVPPWWIGPTAFYDAGTARDIRVLNTAQVSIGELYSDDYDFFYDATTTLTFVNSDTLFSGTNATIGSARTEYLTPIGNFSTESPAWVMPKKGVIYGMITENGTAPGVGESFTYTIRKDGVGTGTAVTVTGGSFTGFTKQPEFVAAGDSITVALVTSAAANAGTHRIAIKVAFFN